MPGWDAPEILEPWFGNECDGEGDLFAGFAHHACGAIRVRGRTAYWMPIEIPSPPQIP
jgi:hypothetical protein